MEINENLICKKIFISHSSRDAEFGQAIVELLLGIIFFYPENCFISISSVSLLYLFWL